MCEYVQVAYDLIKNKYSDGSNNEKRRNELKVDLFNILGIQYDIKCDEENNAPEIMDYNCIVAKIIYNKTGIHGEIYNYINLVFGEEKNISFVQSLLNLNHH
jgi:hypothetical protein